MKNSPSQLANIITVSRIIGVGLLFWLTPFETNFLQLWVITLYTIICVTDFLDGYIARKLNSVSDFGKILDPIADKILVLMFLPLLQMGAISTFPVFIILAREFIVMGIRVLSAKNGQILSAGVSGKIKTAITFPICGILFARVPVTAVDTPFYLKPLGWLVTWVSSWPSFIFDGLIWAMVGVTVWSLLTYLKDFIWQHFLMKADGDIQKAKKSLKLLIPNSITMLNLFCGLLASVYAWFGVFHSAVLLVIVGTILDSLDGKLARKLDAYSRFGAKLDSQADYTNFGIAPAVVIYKLLSTSQLAYGPWIGFVLGFIYYASVHFRLRRFDKGGHSDYFEGLASPVGAGLVVLAAISATLSQWFIFIPIVILIAALMISKIPYPHMDILSSRKLIRALRIPMFIFLPLTLLHLLKINIASQVYAYEILFAIVSVYLFLPLFPSKKRA
jgi:CDP-diacylglycerol--glycerol-3-phosphate 3-phosphatidyltransferase/CDP-diacylglycerol--serine O-phosphatidyltransferase